MLQAANAFAVKGRPVQCERHGHGHINATYRLVTDEGISYVLQKINRHVFKDVPALMHNVSAVTQHLSQADPRPRHSLRLINTHEGSTYFLDDEGEYWRLYDYIPDSICLDRAESKEDFYQSAVAFGTFQNLLADFPAETLHETIPRFHDTPNRYVQFRQAVQEDAAGRGRDVQEEIAFALAREAEASVMMELLQKGELPLRVTHNDTKLNNVMLDAKTRGALCVIDLDTVMPGLAANDFGDSIRFGASTAAEDERDLSLVRLSLELYEAYTRGFLEQCGKRFTPKEIETLPLGAKLMTLENGIRFLADHLAGDVYYRISRPGHNLDRARTQFKLVQEMEAHWQEMADILARVCGELGLG